MLLHELVQWIFIFAGHVGPHWGFLLFLGVTLSFQHSENGLVWLVQEGHQ